MSSYKTVAVSQTAFPLAGVGSVGKKGNLVKRLIITVDTADAGSAVTLIDGSTSIRITASTTPIGVHVVECGMISQTGPWSITTGDAATVIAIGDFG